MPLSNPQINTAALRALLDLLPIGVAIAHDRECSRISVNKAAANILGVPLESNASLSRSDLQLPFKVLVDGKVLPADELPMQVAASRGVEVRDVEVQLVRADGKTLHLYEYASPLRDADGIVVGSVGLFVDITAQKEDAARRNSEQEDSARRMRELNESLEHRVAERTAEARNRAEQLRTLALDLADAEARERKRLAQLLHDQLQQVLSAAKLRAGLARRGTGDDKTRDQIAQIEQLIEAAIAESRSLTISLSPPVLYDAGLNAAIVALSRDIEQRHGLKISLTFDPAAEPRDEGVRVLLFEAVREMLNNVVVHAGATQVTISSDLKVAGTFRIRIADNGRGFDIAQLGAARARSDRHPLGLVEISERLQHIGGSLDLESKPGSGTVVNIQVPAALREIARGTVGAHPSEMRAISSLGNSPERVRVLVADDHEIFRQGLVMLLGQEDFVEIVGEAADGEQAVALSRQLFPDILILDVTMPKLNGVEVAQILSAEQPRLRIVGLSMHDGADMSAAMKRAGAAAYFTKGGPSESLITLLKVLASTMSPVPAGR